MLCRQRTRGLVVAGVKFMSELELELEQDYVSEKKIIQESCALQLWSLMITKFRITWNCNGGPVHSLYRHSTVIPQSGVQHICTCTYILEE